jgi:TonB family protein
VDPRLLAALKFPEPAAASTSALAQAYAATHVPAHEPAPAHSPHESSPGLTREAPGPSAKETPGVSAKEAASSFTFHKGDKKGSKTPLFAGLGLLAVIVGVAGWWFLLRSGPLGAPAAPPTSTLSPAAVAALDRVKELEDKLATLEREKAEAESKAADDAKKKVESQAAARGQQADPAAIQRATDEARKKAKEEQERHQQEELRKLTEQKKAEEDRLAAERKKAEDTARADQAAKAEQARLEAEKAAQVAAATPPPTTQPAAPPTTVATGTKAGTLVNLSDPGVTPPVAERAPPPLYPPIALRQRVEGVVELNVFVDEKGVVVDAQVVQGSGGRAGLNEAAIDSVKRRKYRPATKDGVPVKVWMSVRVKFELPH